MIRSLSKLQKLWEEESQASQAYLKKNQINRMKKKGGIGLNVPAFFVFTKGGFHKLRRQEEVGRYPKNLTFCQLLYGRKCQLRGVGGQKKPESL